MLNHVMLIGRLTRDPEKAVTNAGHTVTTFTLAVDRPFKNGQGEQEADFIRIVTWRKLGEVVAEYVQKGRLVAVEGRLQTRSYENNAGQRVYVTEVVAENVVFLDRTKTDATPTAPNQQPQPTTHTNTHSAQPYVVYQMPQGGGQPAYSVPAAPAYGTSQTPAYSDADLPF